MIKENKKELYFRVKGEFGNYIFSLDELGRGLDRENSGVKDGDIKEEDGYAKFVIDRLFGDNEK